MCFALLFTVNSVIFQIQPDMEELTDNAEEIAEEGDSTKDEKKLGRLQFKVYALEKKYCTK